MDTDDRMQFFSDCDNKYVASTFRFCADILGYFMEHSEKYMPHSPQIYCETIRSTLRLAEDYTISLLAGKKLGERFDPSISPLEELLTSERFLEYARTKISNI